MCDNYTILESIKNINLFIYVSSVKYISFLYINLALKLPFTL